MKVVDCLSCITVGTANNWNEVSRLISDHLVGDLVHPQILNIGHINGVTKVVAMEKENPANSAHFYFEVYSE